jgi:hypothetical protein
MREGQVGVASRRGRAEGSRRRFAEWIWQCW